MPGCGPEDEVTTPVKRQECVRPTDMSGMCSEPREHRSLVGETEAAVASGSRPLRGARACEGL